MCGRGPLGIEPEPFEIGLLNDASPAHTLEMLTPPPPPKYIAAPDSSPNPPTANLDKPPQGVTTDPLAPPVDLYILTKNFYDTAYQNIASAAPDPAPGIPEGWDWVSTQILSLAADLQNELAALLYTGSDSWKGAAADGARNNITSSFQIPQALSAAAKEMGTLAQDFVNTINTTRNAIVSVYDNYESDLANFPQPHQQEQTRLQYSQFAYGVMMNTYQPAIVQIAENNPNFNAAGPAPAVHGGNAGPVGTGGPSGVPAVGGAIGGLGAVGGGAGQIPSVGAPSVPSSNPQLTDVTTPGTPQSTTTPQTLPNSSATSGTPAATSTTPAATSATTSGGSASNMSSALQGLGEAAYGPMQGLQSALGQAMNAGRGAGNMGAPAGTSGLGGKPPMPEGHVSGLGGSKGAGGGAGGGPGAGPAIGKPPAGAPATAATADRTVAAGYRAGLSSAPGAAGAGAPGAGAPAAGQHGANAQPAPYQPNKVLRRKKNGEELIGDTEAVVPVLGAPAPKADAKSDAT